MASSHDIVFVENIITGNVPEGLLTEYDTVNKVDLGIPLTDIGPQTGKTGVTKAFLLSPKGKDYIFTAVCEGCQVVASLQMSPDGVNWCDCVLSDGNVCEVTCSAAVGDCTIKIVDVSILQYVRLIIGQAGTSNGVCTVRLNFTLN